MCCNFLALVQRRHIIVVTSSLARGVKNLQIQGRVLQGILIRHLAYFQGSSKLLSFLHGNLEDLRLAPHNVGLDGVSAFQLNGIAEPASRANLFSAFKIGMKLTLYLAVQPAHQLIHVGHRVNAVEEDFYV